MINGKDLYKVLSEVVPLYVAMILAYGSVRWWKIFTPDQCSGINKFVALFAVPLLSFTFISNNNPYSMNYPFIAADTLQKIILIVILSIWAKFSSKGSLDWIITLFSLSTLPNTLVMGIPLLQGMYGHDSGTLMEQIVVLQCIIWYTLILFLFEYRGARNLISEQFPENGGSIVSIKVDSDVVSIGGKEMLETQAELGEDGKIHVTLRKSTSSRSEGLFKPSHGPSNLTNAEIYSLHSSRNQTPRGSSFNHTDFGSFVKGKGLSSVSGRASSFRNLGIDEESGGGGGGSTAEVGKEKGGGGGGDKDLLMFVWSSRSSSVSERGLHVFRNGAVIDCGHDLGGGGHPKDGEGPTLSKLDLSSTTELGHKATALGEPKPGSMAPASVMTRLILIMVWRKLVRNPNTYSSLIGLTWSLISYRWHVQMPAIVAQSIQILSNTGLGMAMFSLGLFMALQPRIIACGKVMATFSMAIRFITGPAVMAAASVAVGLRGVLLHIAIVQAALPQAIVPFVFAKEYNLHPDIQSTTVIFGMLIALPVTLVYYILLGL